MRSAVGLRPDPLGSYSAAADPLAVIVGRGRRGERTGWEYGGDEGEGREGREWVGRDGKGRVGRGGG